MQQRGIEAFVDLLSEARDVDIDHIGFRVEVVVPDRLKKHGVSGPTTVYRALHRLILDGTVHRIETLNAYVVCTHPEHRAAPTFVICEQCNLVTEINDNKIDAHLRQRTCKVGVVFKTASIEIRGTCATCLPKLPVKTRP